MSRYRLAVIYPCPVYLSADDPRRAFVEEVFTISTSAPLKWVRQHADDLAEKVVKRPYVALSLRQIWGKR